MSVQGHLTELERRHKALKRRIETEAHHPAFDDLELHQMKRKKLQLKDEISKLRDGPLVSH